MIVLEFIRLLPMYKRGVGKKRKERKEEDDDDSSIVHIWFILIDPETCSTLFPSFLFYSSASLSLKRDSSSTRYFCYTLYIYKGKREDPQLNFTILYMACVRACVMDDVQHTCHTDVYLPTPLPLAAASFFLFLKIHSYISIYPCRFVSRAPCRPRAASLVLHVQL